MIARELSELPRMASVKRSYALNVDAQGLALSDRLRIARDMAGLSQNRLAKAADVSVGMVSNLEYGKIKGDPSARTIGRLAQALGKSMDWLWFGDRGNG